MSDFLDDVRQYASLRNRQKELEAKVKAVKDAADQIQQNLLERFGSEGVASLNLGGQTVYLHKQVWAGVKEGSQRSDLIEALRESGLSHFVSETFNTQTLSAYVREILAEEQDLPPEIAEHVKISEVYSLRVRKSD